MDARLAIDGINVDAVSGAGGITGVNAAFYLAPRGRFFFSLAAREGFTKAGDVRDNTLSFTIDGSRYVLTCSEKIAPGPDAYNLYVRHDASYRPQNTSDIFFFSAGR